MVRRLLWGPSDCIRSDVPMARIDSLYCPFTPKVHSDAASVHEGSVLWAQSLGLLPTEQHSRTAYKAKVGWLVARAFPTAMTSGLQLAADWTVLFCILDDYIEKLETADEVEACLQHLLDLLRADIAGSSDDPFAMAMLDLRQRLLAMASPSFVASFADRLEELFAGNVAEARHRENAQILDVDSYVQLRQVTIGLQVMFVLAELAEGLSLPDNTREHPALKKLATRTTNIVAWANDLFTYEKEILQGEMHNLVAVLMNERRLTITEAV